MASPKIKVFGRRSSEIMPFIETLGLRVVEENPDVVVSYGGDGTLLMAEGKWPGVPKVALRDSRHCRTCSHRSNETILNHLAENKLKRTEFIKLRAEALGETMICINDINLNKASVNAGVRYRVWIDDELYAPDEIIGDGLIVSTPFGSAAYYRSITHSTFRVGIGLAFNNSIEPINHLVLGEESEIRIRVTRGPALLAADNNPRLLNLDRDDEILVRRAEQYAVLLAYDRVRYPADQFIFFERESENETNG